MKGKIVIFILFIFAVNIFIFTSVEARRGCCSHHGGVCGCGCCDGTPLSATCAPYYDCGRAPAPSIVSIPTPKPVPKTCPTHSTGVYPTCVCESGYAKSLNNLTCVKIPKNSHPTDSKTDIWMCNSGYEEIGNSCILKIIEKKDEKIQEKVEQKVSEVKKQVITENVLTPKAKQALKKQVETQQQVGEVPKTFFEKVWGWLF